MSEAQIFPHSTFPQEVTKGKNHTPASIKLSTPEIWTTEDSS